MRAALQPSLLALPDEGLAVQEKLGGLHAQAATDEARAACERPQEMAHLPGIAVFLDGRLRRQHKA